MQQEKKLDRFCVRMVCLAALIAVGVLAGCMTFAKLPEAGPPKDAGLSLDYVNTIFDDSYVHEIDIQLPQVNWDYMVRFAEEEQYVLCTVVIDGEAFENVAIRPKGNSSLSAIKAQDSDRFSFKIEFDHYRKGNTFHGLDKLALNNLGQDVSCMKDFLTYHMMNAAGVAAPLSSYVQVKLNGEDFGLYLAVEAIEDSFALRNYGSQFGNIYKPECFGIANLTPEAFISTDVPTEDDLAGLGPGDRVDLLGKAIRTPFERVFGENMAAAALQYVGDDPKSYDVFYESSVFDLTKGDKQALISAIRELNGHPRNAVDYSSVIPYFAVHNFVNNYDSYTGIFVHNYYLRESEGKLSMIPWDYNLAFGVFTFESAVQSLMGENARYQVDLSALGAAGAMDDKTNMVNYPIDTPTFTVDVEERPLLAAVLQDEEMLDRYHSVFREFLDSFFASGEFERLYRTAWDNIAPLVQAGQSFYTYDQFCKASEAVYQYSVLRERSIRAQLDGKLSTTMEGQSEDWENLVDASHVNLASSVTFDSLVFGITSEDVQTVFDAVAGEHPHDSDGVTAALAEMAENPSAIGAAAGRILTTSRIVQRFLWSFIAGPTALIVSIICLAAFRKRTMRYRRRR